MATQNNKIILKKSAVAGKVPVATDLEFGELAVNYEDGRIYFKTASSTIDFFQKVSDTDDVSEGSNNLYYTDARANTAIDNRVTQNFVNDLNVDAQTLEGNDSDFFITQAVAFAVALG